MEAIRRPADASAFGVCTIAVCVSCIPTLTLKFSLSSCARPPCSADPLVKVKEAAGTLIVPTDEVLTVMLDRANLTYDKVVGNKVQVQSLLALLTSLAPTLNLQVRAAVSVA